MPRAAGAKIIAMKSLHSHADFGALLRHILVFEKRQPMHHVAAELGMTAHAFCARLRNGGHLDPDAVAILLRVVADERLPLSFFAGSGLLLVKHTIASRDGGSMTLQQRIVTCAVAAISAICELAHMLEASRLETPRKYLIEERLDRALGALLSIKLQVSPLATGSDVAPRDDAHEDFAHLVRRVLVTGQGVRSQALAERLKLSYHPLHARLSGHVAFLPAELRRLFRMFPDPRIADYLLTGTAYTAILRPAVIESRIDGTPIETGLLSLREMVEFLKVLLLTEDTPGPDPPAMTDAHLDEAMRQLATLRWNLTYIGQRGGQRSEALLLKGTNAA
jgi:hypothetical protein